MVKTYQPKALPVPEPPKVHRTRRQASIEQQQPVASETEVQLSLASLVDEEPSSSTKRKKVKAKKGRGKDKRKPTSSVAEAKEDEQDDDGDKMAVDSIEQSASITTTTTTTTTTNNNNNNNNDKKKKRKKRPVKDEDEEEEEDLLPEEQSSKGSLVQQQEHEQTEQEEEEEEEEQQEVVRKPKRKRAKKEVVVDEDEEEEENLYKLTIPQLKAKLRAIGLSPGGTKSVLVARLQAGLPVFTLPEGQAVTYEWDDPKATSKEWKIEHSSTSRAECIRCREKIEQGMLRLSFSTYKFEYNANVDRWYHAECFGSYPPQGMSTVEDFDKIRFARGFNDQALIAKMRASFAPLVSDDDKITDDALAGEKVQRQRIRSICGCTEAKAAEMDKLIKARSMHASDLSDEGLHEFLTNELDAKFWHSLSAGAARDAWKTIDV